MIKNLPATTRQPEAATSRPAPKVYPVTTGELRSRLQPVVFMRLLEALDNPDRSGPDLEPDDLVAVQFWGPAVAAVTAPQAKALLVEGRAIHATWHLGTYGTEVSTAELRANLQPIVLARLVEAVTGQDGSTLGAGRHVTALTDLDSGRRVVARTNTVHVAWI